MNTHEEYEAWNAQVYEEIRDNAPESAGEPLGADGEFRNVGFHIGAADGNVVKGGGVLIAVTITNQDSVLKGKHTQILANLRNDNHGTIATEAIATYIRLRARPF
jgi:hypothetical protein